jgi:hypothetical protein
MAGCAGQAVVSMQGGNSACLVCTCSVGCLLQPQAHVTDNVDSRRLVIEAVCGVMMLRQNAALGRLRLPLLTKGVCAPLAASVDNPSPTAGQTDSLVVNGRIG